MCSYNDFVTDYNNPNITTHDVRRINNLNSKQYLKLRSRAIRNGDIPKVRHMNSTGAKFYYQKSNGDWSVQKQYSGRYIHVGDFPNETTARMIVEECKSVDWEVNKIQDVIDLNRVRKVKNYSLVNGYWVISKTIDGETVVYCTLNADRVDEDTVKCIVERFRCEGWSKSVKDDVLLEFNIT